MGHYTKPDDGKVLDEIKAITKERPSYGYKRVTALINKERKKVGAKSLNRKRVYRVMKINGLLLKTDNNPRREHQKTGQIITLHSNTRWCSDAYEIHCFNGEKVYVAFALDCHDRECLAHVARKQPLTASDIQELMLLSVESRFEDLRAPRQVQWLSDRGTIYRSHATVQLARNLNLKSCFTAAYSPESNGMSEAFVATSKRDYVYTSDCYDADSVIAMIPDWYRDYNENAPHSGLGMKSPLEYRNSMN